MPRQRRIIDVNMPEKPPGRRGRKKYTINEKLAALMVTPVETNMKKSKKEDENSSDEELDVAVESLNLVNGKGSKQSLNDKDIEKLITEVISNSIKLQIDEIKNSNDKLAKDMDEFKSMTQKEKDEYMKQLKGFSEEQLKELKDLMKKTKDDHKSDVINARIETANELRYTFGNNII